MAPTLQSNPRAQFAVIDQDGAGTTAIVAAQGAGKRIVVMNYLVALDTAGTYTFKSATTQISGEVPCAEDGGVMASSDNPDWPLFVTAANEALNLVTTGGAADGHICYYVEGYYGMGLFSRKSKPKYQPGEPYAGEVVRVTDPALVSWPGYYTVDPETRAINYDERVEGDHKRGWKRV